MFGLAVYSALLYAVLLLFDVTLTLPGFAGMILAIGVAAERACHLRANQGGDGRTPSIRAAIAVGYKKGFSTIVDANIVTAITARGPGRGRNGRRARVRVHAAARHRGLSIVTAVFFTRALLGMLANFRWFDNPAFHGRAARRR